MKSIPVTPSIPECETSFRLLFEGSADAILLLDTRAGIFVDCNAAALSMMGATDRNQLLMSGPADLSPERQPDGTKSAELARRHTEAVLERGTHRFEWLARRFDGTEFPVEVSLTAVQHGASPLVAATCRDISEHRAHQEALRASEARWRRVFEQMPLSIQVFAPDGTTLRVNQAYQGLFHMGLADLEGFNIRSDSQLGAAGLLPLVERAFAGEVVSLPPIPFQLRTNPGDSPRGRRWIGATMFPLNDSRGRLLEVVCVHHDITDRKQAEDDIRLLNATLEQRVIDSTAELRASEARLRTLIDNAPEAIVVFDAETGRFVECNENACRLWGLSRETLLQRYPWEVSPERQPDGTPSIDLARHHIDEVRRGGAPVFDWLHRHESGRLIPCEVRLVALPGEGPGRVRGSIIDNTERHRREKVQRATYDIAQSVLAADDLDSFYGGIHAIIRRLLPATNFYIALLEPAAGVIHFPYFADEHGDRPGPMPLDTGLTGQVLRTQMPLIVTSEMETRKRKVDDRVVIDGVVELPYRERGHPAASWLGVPLFHGGAAIGVMAVQDYNNPRAYGLEDQELLTYVAAQVAIAVERRRAQEQLRESEQSYRALFEASSQGVMINDENEFLQVNEAAARLFGYRREEILGRHPRDLAPPFQPDGERSDVASARHINRCLETGEARFEWVSQRADGTDVPLDVVLTRIEMGGRRVLQAMVTDISERKRAEAELKRALEHERELSQLKSNFVSMVSHEFRTPLGIIQSSAEILEDYLEQLDPNERREQLRSIIKNSRRMAGLMEEVLVLGRLDAGRMQFQPAPLDLAALCRRLVDEVMSTMDGSCTIEFFTADLPEQGMADERLLRHILLNLLTNAVKYSEPDQRVAFHARAEGAFIEFRVEDQGIGIPAGEQDRLFEAFHRGSNVGQRPGTGLGLVIVKRCVELHGGTIHIDSAVGRGTRVRVRIPCGNATDD